MTCRARRRLLASLAAIWLISPLLLAAARWPSWWAWIAPEQTPMTWLQSSALVLAAIAALGTAHVLRLTGTTATRGASSPVPDATPARTTPPPVSTDDPRRWQLLAVGLGLLAVDERFALHERVRDGVLAPRDVTVPFLPWVGPGDFLLLAVGLVGLAALPMIWRAVGPERAARRALLLAVTMAVIAVGMDSIDPASWSTGAERVQQTTEEIIELGSGLALLATVALCLLNRLDSLSVKAGSAPQR